MKKATQKKILSVIATIMLAFVYFSLGFTACAYIPQVTEELAKLNSADEISPFSKDELVDLAVITRDYTVNGGNRDDVMNAISEANKEANTPYASLSPSELIQAPESYTFNEEVFNHLDDVHSVLSRVSMPIICLTALAIFCLMTLLSIFGIGPVGKVLLGSGISLFVAFALIGGWAAFDFNGLFSAIHSLFFAAGSWTFPYDSLLICMYPIPFWLGMGAVWLGTSCLLSIVSIIAGIVLTMRHNHQVKDDISCDVPEPGQEQKQEQPPVQKKQKPAKAHPSPEDLVQRNAHQ